MTPAQRSLRARMAAHAMHAKHDPQQVTEKGRAAFLARFEHQVDPNGILPPEERRRCAEHARKAHMTKLALASARSRAARARKTGGEAA